MFGRKKLRALEENLQRLTDTLCVEIGNRILADKAVCNLLDRVSEKAKELHEKSSEKIDAHKEIYGAYFKELKEGLYTKASLERLELVEERTNERIELLKEVVCSLCDFIVTANINTRDDYIAKGYKLVAKKDSNYILVKAKNAAS
jgi:hypothetical protein